LDPAVVRDEEDEGVFRESFFIQVIEEFPASFVEPFTHGPIAGDVKRVGFGGVLFQESFWWVMRGVREERGVPDKEWLLSCVGDEIEDGFHALASDLEADIAVTSAACGVAVSHAVSESAPAVVALPPFPGLEAEKALRGEEAGECRNVVDEGDTFLDLLAVEGVLFAWFPAGIEGDGGFVAGDSTLMGVESGDGGCERRAAEAGGDVASGEEQALGG